MALKGDRKVILTLPHPNYVIKETLARGAVVCGSGVDSSGVNVARTISSAADISTAKVIGILLDDVIDMDRSARLYNVHKNEIAYADRASIMLEGIVRTNMLAVGVTTAGGQKAYLHPSGLISNTEFTTGSGVLVGRFLDVKDSDGYATVHYNV